MRVWIHIILFALLVGGFTPTKTHAKNLDSASWAKMAEKYDYPPPKIKEKKKEEEKTEPKKTSKTPKVPSFGGTGFINVLLYIGIAALIALLIFVLIQADVIKVGKRNVQLNPTYDAENPDELVLTELEKELNLASEANNYNRCLRYEFLLLLEKLQSKGLIRWHKYNTNGDYLNQLLNYTHHKRIRSLTMVYEYYWYGEHILSLEDYEKLAVSFGQLREEMDRE
ncbi:MAG: hypothetical protein ACI8SE_002201 [Bacteroidia bacterium]|jgi:hypothetical protein